MKLTPEHVAHIAEAIKPWDIPYRRQQYEQGKFYKSEKVTDLDKRYRWDLFWLAGLSKFAVIELYSYAHDGHIDTALKQLVKPLGGQSGESTN